MNYWRRAIFSVTLRSVRDTSWRATGLVRLVWLKLDVEQGHQEELARITGISRTDLSSLNSGAKPMTLARAEKIADAVPGVSVLDLQPTDPPISEREARNLDLRLEELEDGVSELLDGQRELLRLARSDAGESQEPDAQTP